MYIIKQCLNLRALLLFLLLILRFFLLIGGNE